MPPLQIFKRAFFAAVDPWHFNPWHASRLADGPTRRASPDIGSGKLDDEEIDEEALNGEEESELSRIVIAGEHAQHIQHIEQQTIHNEATRVVPSPQTQLPNLNHNAPKRRRAVRGKKDADRDYQDPGSHSSSDSEVEMRTDEWLDVTVGIMSPRRVYGTTTTTTTATTTTDRSAESRHPSKRRRRSESPFRFTKISTANRPTNGIHRPSGPINPREDIPVASGSASATPPDATFESKNPRLSPSDIFIGIGDSILSTPSNTPSPAREDVKDDLPSSHIDSHPRFATPAPSTPAPSSSTLSPILRNPMPHFDLESERLSRMSDLQTLLRLFPHSRSQLILSQHLAMRAFEPLLPSHWAMDFKTLPDMLFTRDDDSVVINSLRGEEYRAQRALKVLMSLGARLRARWFASWENGKDKHEDGISEEGAHSVEELLGREIERYLRWSIDDSRPREKANFDRDHDRDHDHDHGHDPESEPLVEVLWPRGRVRALDRDEKLQALERGMERRLRTRAAVYRQPSPDKTATNPPSQPLLLSDPPTLYGIVIIGLQCALVTYDAARELNAPSETTPSNPSSSTNQLTTPPTSGPPIPAPHAPLSRTKASPQPPKMMSMGLCNFAKGGQDVWNAFSIAILCICARNQIAARSTLGLDRDRDQDRNRNWQQPTGRLHPDRAKDRPLGIPPVDQRHGKAEEWYTRRRSRREIDIDA